MTLFLAALCTWMLSASFIFLSLNIMSMLCTTTQLGSGGTFRTTPAMFQQLYTVHVMYRGKVRYKTRFKSKFTLWFLSCFFFVLQFLPYRLCAWQIEIDPPMMLLSLTSKRNSKSFIQNPICNKSLSWFRIFTSDPWFNGRGVPLDKAKLLLVSLRPSHLP